MQSLEEITPTRGWVHNIVRSATYLFFRIWHRGVILGRENVPKKGAIIIAPNHVSNLDPPFIQVSIPRTAVASLTKVELFMQNPFANWIMPRLNCVPVDRERPSRPTIALMKKVIEEGQALLLFPEGTRSEDGKIQEFHDGMARTAYKNKIPIIPTHILGTGAGGYKGRKVISFGKAIMVESLIPEGVTLADKELYQLVNAAVKEAIEKLEVFSLDVYAPP